MLRAVGVFIFQDGKFLILKRAAHKPQGGQWGLPAGKIDDDETPRAAALRELHEETGYAASMLEELGSGIWELPNYDLEFTTFRITLTDPITVHLREGEHDESKWITPAECLAMDDAIYGLQDLVKQYFPPG